MTPKDGRVERKTLLWAKKDAGRGGKVLAGKNKVGTSTPFGVTRKKKRQEDFKRL